MKNNKNGTLNFTPILAIIIVIVLASATYNLSHKTTSFNDAIGTRQLSVLQAQSKIHKINGYVDRAADISLEKAVAQAAINGLGKGCGTHNGLVLYNDKSGDCFPSESETSDLIEEGFNSEMTKYLNGFSDLNIQAENYALSLFYSRDSTELIASAKYKQTMKVIAEEEKDIDFEYVPPPSGVEGGEAGPVSSPFSEAYSVWPLDNNAENSITCFWGPRTTTSLNKQHYGIDIDDTVKQSGKKSNVFAVADGVVTAVLDTGDSYDRYVEIDHDKDSLRSVYVHLDDVLVKVGQKVGKGDSIATINKDDGSHLHLSFIQRDFDTSEEVTKLFTSDQIVRADSSSLKSYPLIKRTTKDLYYVNPICFFDRALTDKSMDGKNGRFCSICNQCGDFDENAGCSEYLKLSTITSDNQDNSDSKVEDSKEN
ncbi:M23 family metallopeptidase [Candidatus Woesearchaeota archaeon]|nr:M23 family metallopeptidase [Candidatus Woesearchaeota archaeon]